MGYKVALSKIEDIISKTHFANDGDSYERLYWTFFKERFPKCETFWRYFVVPFTKRIELEIEDPNERIHPRDGISEDIKDIASFHYSMFLNLIYSYDHLQNFRLSSFEDFYTHLGSACDLAEEFLLKTYLLILECTDQKSEILQELKKEDFLKLAEKWYDDNFSKVYRDYLEKGKPAQIKLPSRKNVLDEYFKDQEDWRQYKRYSQKIREYRNIIVHDIQIGKIISFGGIPLVPKKEKIQNYKKWSYAFVVQQDIQKLRNDFINMKEQMILDIGSLEIILNNLWAKPINDLRKLFFDDKNKILLRKYNIDLI
ncbi:MAG: hypothetical protein QMC78_05560 [Methanocellales archaeon]|nr:hypothetical protein [Methanocellales archaeon]